MLSFSIMKEQKPQLAYVILKKVLWTTEFLLFVVLEFQLSATGSVCLLCLSDCQNLQKIHFQKETVFSLEGKEVFSLLQATFVAVFKQ